MKMFKMMRSKLLKRFFRGMEDYDITMEELLAKKELGAEIVDVRSKQEYEEGHIDDAINIPEYQINVNITNILKSKDKPIVLYCSSGSRSKTAYKKLKKLGYSNLYNLYGGLESYS